MNLEKLEKILKESNQPKFRLDQIKKAVFGDGVSSFSEISTIPLDLRKRLEKEMDILSFEVEKILISNDKRSIKALLRLKDNNCIESVLLSPRLNTWTVCISSQVGCSLGCAFCATGKGGLKRNLTAEEITDQILFWKQYLEKGLSSHSRDLVPAIDNVVYMGMGEPMLNWENVKKSVEDLINPKLFNFGSRSISISTVGVKGGIEKFLTEFPQVNLAISLHFANNEMRSKYMPANKAYNLEDIKKDLQEYFKKSKRKIFMEYIIFEGLNDSLDDAKKLIEYLRSIGNSYLLHVNLIAYNMEHEACNKNEFKASSKNKIEKFKDFLLQNKINVTIRKSLGTEIAGACGQLAGK
jgi:23S rRNA (adenine(2503)-C(2))-methyltransferase